MAATLDDTETSVEVFVDVDLGKAIMCAAKGCESEADWMVRLLCPTRCEGWFPRCTPHRDVAYMKGGAAVNIHDAVAIVGEGRCFDCHEKLVPPYLEFRKL